MDMKLVSSPNGITAKLFGPWLWVEHNGCLNFINTPIEDDQRQCMVAVESEGRELAHILKWEKRGKQKENVSDINEDR